MTFQVGDLVEVLPQVQHCSYGCNEDMVDMIGKEFSVSHANQGDNRYFLDGVQWVFDAQSLQLVQHLPSVSEDEFSPFSAPPPDGRGLLRRVVPPPRGPAWACFLHGRRNQKITGKAHRKEVP